MTQLRSYKVLFLCGTLLLAGMMVLHLVAGEIPVSFQEFKDALFNYDPENTQHIIARDFRIPRMLMAVLSGAGLSVAGLLMQNLFNNPLAGPNILGISTGSSLFVAFSIMTGIPFFTSDTGVVSSALIGALIFGLIILFFSLFARSQTSLLLIGIMIGSFSSAFVSILQTMSDVQQLKAYTLWAMGSLQHVTFEQLPLLIAVFLVGIVASLGLVRTLNALSIGDTNARLLGIQIRAARVIIIAITALITGLITAYCGPIAFVGLAVPNMARMLFKTQNHLILIPACLFTGAIFVLACDILIQLLDATIHLPFNAITSLIGAPFVIFIILKRLT